VEGTDTIMKTVLIFMVGYMLTVGTGPQR